MKYTIDVTAEDIEKGVRLAACNCPITRAAKRVVFQAEGDIISVAPTRLSVGARNATLPDEAYEFVQRFDKGLPVEPFSFEIEIPEAA